MQQDSLSSVDIFVSSIQSHGLRLPRSPEYEPYRPDVWELLRAVEQRGVAVRIITTWQLGTPEYDGAIEDLADLTNVEIRVSDARESEFHTSRWLFRHAEHPEYDAAIIGSSDIVGLALTTGTNWNVTVIRESSPETPESDMIDHFQQRFEEH